jgi:hypothetical protein
MVLTRQSGSGIKNGVNKVSGNALWTLVSYGYHKGLVNVNDLSIDSSTVAAKKGGKRLATTGTRRRKEAKYMQ